jgi:hypothetical protein
MVAEVRDQHVEVVIGAGMDREDRDRCAAEVRRSLVDATSPVGVVRIRLNRYERPGLLRPFVGQAEVLAAGEPVRAVAAVSSRRELPRLLGARLAAQVAAAFEPFARPWPDGRATPEPVAPASGESRVVRRKAVPLQRCDPTEAAFVMDRLDRGFQLFVDAQTGAESVVRRVGPTGYRLTRIAGMAPAGPAEAVSIVPMTIDVYPVPTRPIERIVRRMEVAELDHRFFRDAATGHGAVLYRRFDGDLTLLCGEHNG